MTLNKISKITPIAEFPQQPVLSITVNAIDFQLKCTTDVPSTGIKILWLESGGNDGNEIITLGIWNSRGQTPICWWELIFQVSLPLLTHCGIMTPHGGQRTRSTLAQVMACCLTASSHYLNKCWLLITVKFCCIHLRTISLRVILIYEMGMNITLLNYTHISQGLMS